MPSNFDPYAICDSDISCMIFQDFQFPVNDPFGSIRWYASTDIRSGDYCAGLLAFEKLAKLFFQTNGPAFLIARSYTGTVLKKATPAGKRFLETQHQDLFITTPMGYLPSEAHQALTKVAKDQNLGLIAFSQNPLATVNLEGLLEADLANSFVIRIREALEHPSTKNRIETRKKLFHHRSKIIHRNLDRLQLMTVQPRIVEIRLDYLGGAKPFSLEDSEAHIKQFVADIQESAYLPLWHFWKRQHTSETGFNYRCLFVFDSLFLDSVQNSIHHLVGLWQQVTDGRGIATWSQDFGADFKAASRHAKMMFQRDMILQLQESPELQHFGIGDPPVITKNLPKTPAVPYEPSGLISHLI